MVLPAAPEGFLHYLVRCSVLGWVWLAGRVTSSRQHYGWKDGTVWPGPWLIIIAGLCWQAVVALWVPEPYLDEIFHIPQAQKYCEGRWLEWDDKITTPPGLYTLSVAINRLMWFIPGECSPLTLRMTNWLAIIFMPYVALHCRRLIEARYAERVSHHDSSSPSSTTGGVSIYAIHTAVNVALFPLLFFFSGLYYTDVFSTLVVLLAFWNHLEREGQATATGTHSWRSDAVVILLGVACLFMRQTNVFWVVVFLGGLEAVHAVRSLRPPPTSPGEFDPKTMVKFYLWRYSQGEVHDPPLNEAGLEDVFFCALSLAIAVVCNPLRVLRQIWARILVLVMFAGFVVWNGGVVLGDKSNHVATIHLAQLLYIWPLFAFFSAPLLLPAVLQPIISRFGKQSKPGTLGARAAQSSTKKTNHSSTISSLISIAGYASLAPLALSIVKFSTIIHPFTLADNRHYMFYVFRYSILRAGWVRFALVPVYVGCGILCWRALGGFSSPSSSSYALAGPQSRPKLPKKRSSNAARSSNNSTSTTSTSEAEGNKSEPSASPATPPAPQAGSPAPAHADLSTPGSTSTASPSLSTALLWILATTLSLMTAPLVEPRYFILPWVTWRLLAPAWSISLPHDAADNNPPIIKTVASLARRYDLRLWLETAWFGVVNVLTMYIFVTRPFYWRDGEGNLADGGRVQRFMW